VIRRSIALGGVLCALVLFLLSAASADAALSYSTSSALKKAGCSGDGDGDCLDDSIETGLAWAVSPWYFYDEDEGCSAWENDFGQSPTHFARRDYVQVRPHDRSVWSWTPTDGRAKWVTVTFFFLYPHDCGGNFGFAGHQGDSERVRFNLYSYDLTTWYLSYAYYDRHGRPESETYVSGSFLQSRAIDLGTSWASVAADEDKHGSWQGRVVGSSHCAGSEDDFCFGSCDCFQGDWEDDFANGWYDVPSGSRNIGGPWPESWNPTYVSVAGSDAWTELDVGHGLNREYWSDESGTFQWFCGWECPIYYRATDGHCIVNVHDRSNCAEGPLSSKVDTFDFSPLSGLTATPAALTADAGGSFETRTSEPIAFAAAAGDPPRAARARELARSAAERLTRAADARPADDKARILAERSRDLVAALVPQLLGMPRTDQAELLRWALTVPDDRRLVSLFDDLGALAPGERVAEARRRIGDLLALLASEGFAVPAGGKAPAVPLARVAPDAPAPDRYPEGVVVPAGDPLP
jgi:hypothetical protein